MGLHTAAWGRDRAEHTAGFVNIAAPHHLLRERGPDLSTGQPPGASRWLPGTWCGLNALTTLPWLLLCLSKQMACEQPLQM